MSTEIVGTVRLLPLLACVHCIGGTAGGEKAFHPVLALSVLVLHGKPVTPCICADGVSLPAVIRNVQLCFLCCINCIGLQCISSSGRHFSLLMQ